MTTDAARPAEQKQGAGLPVPVAAPAGIIKGAGTVGEAVAAFDEYQQLRKQLMQDGDYADISGKKHPTKSFVRKLQRFFNLSVELIQDEGLYDPDGELIGWICTARAIHSNGASMQSTGSCSFDEKRPAQRTLHNIRAHAETRAKNRAVMDLVGFGDVTADEFGEPAGRAQANRMRRPRSQTPPKQAEGQNRAPVASAGTSEGGQRPRQQRKRTVPQLKAYWNGQGWDDEMIYSVLEVEDDDGIRDIGIRKAHGILQDAWVAAEQAGDDDGDDEPEVVQGEIVDDLPDDDDLPFDDED